MLLDLILDLIDIFDKLYWTDERLGKYGETLTARKLMLTNLLGKKGKILRNLYLPTDDGGTSEIDLIFITQKGIFVIESKNYSGWIFGRQYDQYWTQSLPNRIKNRFYNPIRQNNTHIKWLKQFLNRDIPLYSFIVFSERCELKNVSLKDDSVFVMKRDELRSYIKHVWKNVPDVLTTEEITQLYDKLLPLTKADEALKAAHVDAIRQKFDPGYVSPEPVPAEPEIPQEETAIPAAQPPAPNEAPSPAPPEEVSAPPEPEEKCCPQCGAKLVLRTARRGANAGNQFYGCSAFPKCRYILNIPPKNDGSGVSDPPTT